MQYIKVCPKCGSTNISPTTGLGVLTRNMSGWDYRCKDCGFGNDKKEYIFPEVEVDKVEEFRKDLKRISEEKNKE